ncbi:MAG: histidine kinase, partial [Caulobacter sp.]
MKKPSLLRSHQSAVVATCAVWGVGYVLAMLMAFATGNGRLPLDLLLYGPMWLTGVGQSIALLALWRALSRLHPAGRWLIAGLGALAAAAVQALFDGAIFTLIQRILPNDPTYAGDVNTLRLARLFILYAWTFCLTITLFWAVSRERDAVAAEQRATQAELRRREAEFQALRLQLNPHFLFNSLNGVSTLLMERKVDEADAMVIKMANFLRAIMSADPRAMGTVASELATIEAYLAVEEMRFGSKLQWTIDCDQAARELAVPALLLQPLVENAVKHAVAPSDGPVRIRIEARLVQTRLLLVVEDDGSGAPSRTYGAGVGLQNVRSRLASYYGAEAAFDTQPSPSGYGAHIDLPARR